MTYKLIITVVHHSDGRVTVGQNLTAPLPADEEWQLAKRPESFRHPTKVFNTSDEAEVWVEQLVSENRGLDAVKIDRNDFRPKPAS
jgi:hypothetical protein